jgi:hypothetical protein
MRSTHADAHILLGRCKAQSLRVPDQSLHDVCSASANGETMYSSAVRSPVATTRSASYDLQPGFFRCGRRKIKPRQIMILKLAQLKMRMKANKRLQIVNYGR